LVRHRQALLEQSHQLLFAQPLAPMRQRGAIERQLVTEAQFTAEELIIGVFNPARAQYLVRQVMHVLLYRGACQAGPDYLMPTPFCASATDATRGSGFSSRSAPGRLMMG